MPLIRVKKSNRIGSVAVFLCATFLSTATCSEAISHGPCNQENSSDLSLVDYVDPFIATRGEANGFPGPQRPFGLVSLSPDCGDLTTNAGYCRYTTALPDRDDNRIRGFSHLHVSGTGGGPKYGVILLSPMNDDDFDVIDYGSRTKSQERATPGYYGVFLNDYKINAELTTSHSVGFHRYRFPDSSSSTIILDIHHHLSRGAAFGENQTFEGGEVRILDGNTMQGFGRYKGGWNKGENYTVYFYAVFDTHAKEFGVWTSDGKVPGERKATAVSSQRLGAFFSYDTSQDDEVLVKVGISFKSQAQARQNVEREIPSWDFDSVVKASKDEWEAVLRKIIISPFSDGTSPGSERKNKMANFYSALYRSHLMPHDRTGEHPIRAFGNKPYFDDYYTIWDTYRTLHPLLTLIQPGVQSRIVQSLLNIYELDGFMPDGRSGNFNGRTQGGSNADIVVADAFVKGLEGIDYELGLQAMLKNSEVSPYPDDAQKHGRGGLRDFNGLGYVSADHARSGTRTVEYSYNDFAIATVAAGLGKNKIRNQYIGRSKSWANLWDPDFSSFGFKGFIRPRDRNGVWDPTFSVFDSGSWYDDFYEDNSWSYSLAVPHDVGSLIHLVGSEERFSDRLDFFFDTNAPDDSLFRIGNEPDFLQPYLYLWTGEPHKTARRVRETLRTQFQTADGKPWLPGNDDAGALSSWYIFSSAGFYPLAGTPVYLVTTPSFAEISLCLDEGKAFTVKTRNYSTATRNPYIKEAFLNGSRLTRAWFTHSELERGGILELVLDDQPSNWATDNTPPSGEELLRLGVDERD